ncbi:MAG: flagellar biosynthesis anti-sigma factor FlgM [bacterium]|nr:flagellar biosynthesis anti-sigma factor FlgM [bacterium]
MKVTTNVDKINSEFIQRDLKRVKDYDSDKKADNFASEDKVEISSKAYDLKGLQAEAMQAPDVRPEKVSAVKAQLDNGTYAISHEKLAERLIEESMLE